MKKSCLFAFFGLMMVAACSDEKGVTNTSTDTSPTFCIQNKLNTWDVNANTPGADPLQTIAASCGTTRDEVLKVIESKYPPTDTNTNTSTGTSTNTSPEVENLYSFGDLVSKIPNDGVCRIRYVAYDGYVILSGKNRTHPGTIGSISDAIDKLHEISAAHMCNMPTAYEPCLVRYLESTENYGVEIAGTAMEENGFTILSDAKDFLDTLIAADLCR